MTIETDDLLVSTIEDRKKQTVEQIGKNSAFWNALEDAGKIKPHKGGKTIRKDLIVRENAGVKRFRGFEKLSTVHSQPLSYAEYPFAQYAANIQISDIEEKLNTGDAAFLDILGERISTAEITLQNLIGVTDTYGDGTADGGRAMLGIQHFITASPTNTVGGVNRSVATNAFWRNQVTDASSELGAVKGVANYKLGVEKSIGKCLLGGKKPRLAVCDENDYLIVTQIAQAIQQVSNPKKAEIGYDSIYYSGIEYVRDGGLGGGCPADTTFLLDIEPAEIKYIEGRYFDLLPKRESVDQAASIRYLVCYLNMAWSRLRTSCIFVN